MDQVQRKLGKSGREARAALRREFSELRKELRTRETKAVRAILTGADVVIGTPSTISPLGPLRHAPDAHFSVAVVDEAGQALEAACWAALLQVPVLIQSVNYGVN
jgi:ATP-dependent RNA/DNA helicase IGHMBP2